VDAPNPCPRLPNSAKGAFGSIASVSCSVPGVHFNCEINQSAGPGEIGWISKRDRKSETKPYKHLELSQKEPKARVLLTQRLTGAPPVAAEKKPVVSAARGHRDGGGGAGGA